MTLVLDLGDLADALSDPDVDLAADLSDLGAEIRSTVRSLVGLSWHAAVARDAYTVTLILEGGDPATVRASLAIPLVGSIPPAGVSELILYASAPGAFRDLAQDPSFLTVSGVTTLSVDRNLEMPATGEAFGTSAVIGQATGVLLARGYSYSEADDQLNQIMSDTGYTRRAAAERILATLRPPKPAPPLPEDQAR